MSSVPGRIVCNFSCGAASAVATKLALADAPGRNVEIVNVFVQEEHPDNRRFLSDCEVWFGRPITVLRDERFGASTLEVFRRGRYMKGLAGAPCSRALKREVMERFQRPGDVVVLGFTAEEEGRFDRYLDANNGAKAVAPLIERGLMKADCLAIIERAGIVLPAMYRMGYQNANCIGCVKGGEGYWNKIRKDFPAEFEAIASIQEAIGPGAYLFRDRSTGRRYSLRELPPDKGRYQDEPDISCGLFCEAASEEISA